MLLADTPVIVDHRGRTCPARDLCHLRDIYDPVTGRYDAITDVLIREVVLRAANQASLLPVLLPDCAADGVASGAADGTRPIRVAVSPRQPLMLPGVHDPAGQHGLRTVLPGQIGLPCLDLIGTTITYVALFFARRRAIRCGGYLLRCYTLADIAGPASVTSRARVMPR